MSKDCVWMAESHAEASHVWSNKNRIVFFFSAMRHFRDSLRRAGRKVVYHELGGENAGLTTLLRDWLASNPVERIICIRPGEWRILHGLRTLCGEVDIALEVREDTHFLDTPDGFREWAENRKSIRLEYYYREMRKRHGILMTPDNQPAGGEWNYDKDNRGTFEKGGPDPDKPEPPRFAPDKLTREVIELVNEHFPGHPGELEKFAWPVSREDAVKALDSFVHDRLPSFGEYQDAMWTEEPFLYHSLLSASLNVKLLNPREVIAAAEKAHADGSAPLNAVEGFIRQVLGWREFVRGIYWWKMPGYEQENFLEAHEGLPGFYWTWDTPFACLADSIGQTLEFGYAHHIQRLMVTGLYGLLLGIEPKVMHEWYLAVYLDAVEWVELPNTLGMSQFGDGGLMASKPYAATGKYIQRMSNYCEGCPAKPTEATGDSACPFTTLYWDFLHRNKDRLSGNQRMSLQLRNLDRLSGDRIRAIRKRANAIRKDPSGKGLFG